PAGILGGDAGQSRLLDGDLDPRQPEVSKEELNQLHPSQAPQADLGQEAPRLQAPGTVDAGIYQKAPLRQVGNFYPQALPIGNQLADHSLGPFVQLMLWHRRISPFPTSLMSPR